MAINNRLVNWIRVLLLSTSLPLATAQTYNIMDLGTFPGGTVSQGQALNDCGHVVGYARFANFNAHGFFWSRKTGLLDIGALPPSSNFSVAQAINSRNIVAGYSTYNNDPLEFTHPILWIGGQVADLGTLPGTDDAQAMGINDSGQVVGFSVSYAFLWTPGNGMQSLGALPGGYYSQGLAINQLGEVAGLSNAADGNWHGFQWTAAKGMQQLPYLLPGDNSASANAINNRGQIVGGSSSGYAGGHAVLWDASGTPHDLGVLPGQGWGSAFAINDHEQVVGWSGFAAFLWTPAKGMQDLNTLIPSNSGWSLSLPTGINNRGQITGQGTINGQQHAFLLTPADEPSWGCE